jgi:hypothetical protein
MSTKVKTAVTATSTPETKTQVIVSLDMCPKVIAHLESAEKFGTMMEHEKIAACMEARKVIDSLSLTRENALQLLRLAIEKTSLAIRKMNAQIDDKTTKPATRKALVEAKKKRLEQYSSRMFSIATKNRDEVDKAVKMALPQNTLIEVARGNKTAQAASVEIEAKKKGKNRQGGSTKADETPSTLTFEKAVDEAIAAIKALASRCKSATPAEIAEAAAKFIATAK